MKDYNRDLDGSMLQQKNCSLIRKILKWAEQLYEFVFFNMMYSKQQEVELGFNHLCSYILVKHVDLMAL
ncbi:hypothetical protein SUGI_1184880 [Cryptomeria japonica]|nr:hypothetical protein SUGI_1184880 [Cryptomeria japonica]